MKHIKNFVILRGKKTLNHKVIQSKTQSNTKEKTDY